MNVKKRIRAIKEVLTVGGKDACGLVTVYADDTPEVREARVEEAREKMFKEYGARDGTIFSITMFRTRNDYVRSRPPDIEKADE
jgi:hypothetical protein